MIAGLPADVHAVVLEMTSAWLKQGGAWLTDAERRTLDSFSHEGRRNAFVLGRTAARFAAASATGRLPSDIEIEVLPSGAVALADCALHLSIAHSGERAAAAVSSRPIGVDIERIRDVDSRLIARITDEGERQALNASGLPRPALACWTLKEAVLKGIGSGLRLAARRVRLELDGESALLTTPEHGTWRAVLRSTESHVLAIAWSLNAD